MLKRLMIVLVALLLLPAPAQAQPKSDYLQESKKLARKTFDANMGRPQHGDSQARTATKNKTGVKRSKKQRRADRRRRGQQKKSEARFGTFNR